MSYDSLRDFLQELKRMGELREIEGAHWKVELGAITEILAERKGPALLFDKISGYPTGYKVATNLYSTVKRASISLGIPLGLTGIDIIKEWRRRLSTAKPIPPIQVKNGPVMENVLIDDDVNLHRFPAPMWHEFDGGRYIGTGSVTITKDSEEDYVNMGTYRVMIHDNSTLSFFVAQGHHAALIREKYWAEGLSCPVAISFGHEPALWVASTLPLPWALSEYEFAGFIKGSPVEVIPGQATGLPLPATAEIVVEGEAPPPSSESKPEGPFGEWTGYYGSGERFEPIIKVKAIYYRNEPIIVGCPPLKPPIPFSYTTQFNYAAMTWNELESAGVPEIKGVWKMEAGGLLGITVVSIKQGYPGHVKQAGLVAAGGRSGGFNCRLVIVVDDDIDPSNTEDVIWALATRCDPETSIDIIRGCWGSPLDPRLPPEKRSTKDWTHSVAIVNACRPFHWITQYPPVNKISDQTRAEVIEKWGDLLRP